MLNNNNWEEKHGMMLQGFSDNQQPIRHQPFDNHHNHPSEAQPTFEKAQKSSHNAAIEAQKLVTIITDEEKPKAGPKMEDLIKFLTANYGPMKTPLEIGTPEYIKLVEILQQSGSYSINGEKGDESSRNNNQEKVVINGQKNDSAVVGILKRDEKKLLSEKVWEGSLQLSSSVTLLATAFFRSGEKLVGYNWPESIEVKGKVRLEAFEKYVKDLPRSRNRGLMVISICWKEGSSDTGLTGMKEVAKGYKKSSRVGFAQLPSGIDLYICPRSDPIITILAKYGFFKGMAVLDDNQDSMIGCVVWRKNRPPNPIKDKTSPDSSPPLNFPPGFERKLSPEPLTLPLTSETNTNMPPVNLDHNTINSASSSSSDSSQLVPKRGFKDDDIDDLPEFDFGAKLVAVNSVNSQKMENSQLTKVTNTVKRNMGDGSLEQLSKKTKLFDNDDDMPEWCPFPQKTPSNFQKLPLCPPRPPPPPLPIPPPPRANTRPSFSYQPFRPQSPLFMGPPPQQPRLPPPPPLPPLPPPPLPPYQRPPQLPFNNNQALWHRPLSNNVNPFLPFIRRPSQP